jgi:hypothetical protein
VFIFTSTELLILGAINRLGSYIGHYLEWLSHRVKGGGLSATAIIDSTVAASIIGSMVAASIIDSTVTASVVISLYYLTGWY